MTKPHHARSSSLSRRSLLAASAATAAAAPAFSVSIEAQENGFAAAVGSSHELATEAAVAVLEDGGTAADASFAAASILSAGTPFCAASLARVLTRS